MIKNKYYNMSRAEFKKVLIKKGYEVISESKQILRMGRNDCSISHYIFIKGNKVIIREGTWVGAARKGKIVDKFSIGTVK